MNIGKVLQYCILLPSFVPNILDLNKTVRQSNKKREIKIFLLENSLGKIIIGSFGEESLESKNGLLPLAKVESRIWKFKLRSFSRINPVALVPIFMVLILFQSMLQL